MIFYTFYKNQQNTCTIWDEVLQTGPRDEKLDRNWVPGAMAGGGSSVPARGRLGSARKGWGSGVGSHRVLFHGLLAAEEQPTMVLHGVARCQPRERLFRRGGGTAVVKGSWVSFGGDQGRCGAAWAGVERCTGRSSAVAAAIVGGGELWEAWTTAHTWLVQDP
jgi:hypothetical protein